jgi:hypothetical protein
VREELAEGVPGGVDFVVVVGGAVGQAEGIGERRGGSAFAGDFSGDAW